MLKELRYLIYGSFMLLVCQKLGCALEGTSLMLGLYVVCYGKETIEIIKAYRIHRKMRKSLKKLSSEEES